MNKESKKFLYRLLETPSPTGFEEEIQQVVKDYIKPYADSIEIDVHGNLIAGINTKAKRRVMLAGHCDQIGFMVRHITKEGYIYVLPLGGIDAGVVYGAQVEIHTKTGKILGVFGRKPIHNQKPEERKNLKIDLDTAWIDIGAKDDKEVKALIEIGDPITYKLGVSELRQDLICSPGLDNRVGLFVAMEALRICSKQKIPVALYAVSTVQEEVGLRGAKTAAYTIDPHVGIAIDVTHASDNPGLEDSKAPPIHLGKGPAIHKGVNVNSVVYRKMLEAANKLKIPFQISPSYYPLGNDANALQVNRGGSAACSIGIPNRYMHTQVEVCSLTDLENSAELVAGFCKDLKDSIDLRPGSKS